MVNNAHPRVEAALDATLRAGGEAMWRAAWRSAAVKHVVVPRALELFDPMTVTFSADWRSLDDAVDRVNRVRAAAIHDAACAELLLQRDELNAALVAAGLRKERAARLNRFLAPLVARLIADPLSEAELQEIFPAAWRPIADAIARNAHQRRMQLGASLEDWQALNERLTAGFFASCVLDKAALVEAALKLMVERGPLGIRGRLVRIVEQTSANGIEDVTPPLAAPLALQQFAHAGLSNVLATTGDAWTSTEQGNGVMHRLVDIKGPSSLLALPPGVTHADRVAARSARYRQYEYTLVT